MTITSAVSDSGIEEEFIEKIFKLDSNFLYQEKTKQQAKIKRAKTMIKKMSFSVERLNAERKMAEYLLEHDYGFSGDFTKVIGPTFSVMSSLSSYRLGLVDRKDDSNNLRCFIYYRTTDKETLSTYIDLMNQLIKEIEKIVK